MHTYKMSAEFYDVSLSGVLWFKKILTYIVNETELERRQYIDVNIWYHIYDNFTQIGGVYIHSNGDTLKKWLQFYDYYTQLKLNA